jgi:hypothetical protein
MFASLYSIKGNLLARCSCKVKNTGLSHADFNYDFVFTLFQSNVYLFNIYINIFNNLAPFHGCKQLHLGVTLSNRITPYTFELVSKACSRCFPIQQRRLRPQFYGTLNNDRNLLLFTVFFLTLSHCRVVSPSAAFSVKPTWLSEILTCE